VAEHLTASELRERLDIERTEFDRLSRSKVWPRARTKEGDRYPWPAALHAYIKERERVARAELPEFIGGSELADLVNRDPRTLHNWQKLGIPHNAAKRGGQYPLAAAVRWVIEHVSKASADAEGKELSLAKQKEQEDLLTARNKRLLSDMEVAKEQGRIVTIDFMRTEFEILVAEIRDVLANLPGELADQVIGLDSKPKARGILRAGVDKGMTALRDALTRVAERSVDELHEDRTADDEEDADDADDAS
jgi:phage terminase Nu1 subunit (DNA packaging protein)